MFSETVEGRIWVGSGLANEVDERIVRFTMGQCAAAKPKEKECGMKIVPYEVPGPQARQVVLQLFEYEGSTRIVIVKPKTGKEVSNGTIAVIGRRGLEVNEAHWKDHGLPVDENGKPRIKVVYE